MNAIELRAPTYHISISATRSGRRLEYTCTTEVRAEDSPSETRPSVRDLLRNRYSRRHVLDTEGGIRIAHQVIADAKERGERIPRTHEALAMGTLGQRAEFAVSLC
jgi:hypothetical protein